MALEIEAKVKVDDHAAVRARLESSGARRLGEVLELNTFFDTVDHRLLGRDEGLRVRRARDAATGAEYCVVTFKGPARAGSELKTREELEFFVTDGGAAEQVLHRLGYARDLCFEKRRESWELDGCHVELDELPRLGRFVEIEGRDPAAVLRVRAALGLAGRPLIKVTYVAMVAALLRESGQADRAVRFA